MAELDPCHPVLLAPVVAGLLPAEIPGSALLEWRVPKLVLGFIGEIVAVEDF